MATRIGLGITAKLPNQLDASVLSIRELSGPSAERPPVDATTFDSTARQFVSGVVDGGELEIAVAWEAGTDNGSTSHEILADAFTLGSTQQPLEISLSANSTLRFDFLVTGVSPVIPVDDLMTCSFTCKVDSGITWPT